MQVGISDQKRFYTLPEIIEITGVSLSTLYKLRSTGDLIFRKFGGRTVVLKGDFDAYVADLPICQAEPQPGITGRRKRAVARPAASPRL
ncbi:helix-turn-helix transcriptional regulator [Rhizobium tumorigenes]|uniref:Helix-turn-helix domain-containing protein n=1 Tax=Rhizobium tumorigenes TaxID=2041385 RepID=A0AAF1KWH2_9HYPH|nr:helix-turn-helix domain-containing protein [Rhizobium tumorigenes]WFR96879.1 helix-turn-helix domain-containing protein [Rhizobium tumorigenes]